MPGESSTICPVCLDPIVDATEDTEGHEAIYCESTCNSWIHRQCAGLSKTLFKKLEESDEPFCCPHCRLVLQDKQLQELKSLVDALSKEVITLKSTTSDKLAPESSSPTPQQPLVQDTETTSSSANKESQPTPNTKSLCI